MADNKNDKNFLQKAGSAIVNFFKKIPGPFKKMVAELKKVTWPSRDKLINYSALVVLVMVFMMIVIGLLDTGASALVNLIMSK